jgi:hypothetical protein
MRKQAKQRRFQECEASRTSQAGMSLRELAVGVGVGLSFLQAPISEQSAAFSPGAAPAETKGEPRRDQYGDPLPPRAVARLGTVRLRPPVPASVLAFSPDGKTLASGGTDQVPDDHTVYLWDAVTTLSYSPNGRCLASGGAVRLLEALEQIGTKETTEWLERLAGGAPGTFLTSEAKASLQRLERHHAGK